MRKVLTLSKFAQLLGFSYGKRKGFNVQLKKLVNTGAIEIEQGGFLGDNMHHPKLVIIKNSKAIAVYFLGKQLHGEKGTLDRNRNVKESIVGNWQGIDKPNPVQYYPLKYSHHQYYVTLDSSMILAFGLLPGDLLKIKLMEVRKHREIAEEFAVSED